MRVGRTNTVSSLGLAKDVGGLPVRVGRTNTVRPTRTAEELWTTSSGTWGGGY